MLTFVYIFLEERMKIPWPLSAREAVVHYFVFEYYEDDLIVCLLNTVVIQTISLMSFLYFCWHRSRIPEFPTRKPE